MLRFFYVDEWVEEVDFALDMLPIADQYSALELKRLLERYLVNSLQPANLEIVAQIFAVADRYSCPRLRGRCVAFMAAEENFNVVVKTRTFADLEKRLILEVLQQAHKAPQPPIENFPGHFAAKGTQPRDMHRRGWLTYAMPTGGARAGGRASPTRNGTASRGAAVDEDGESDDSSGADLADCSHPPESAARPQRRRCLMAKLGRSRGRMPVCPRGCTKREAHLVHPWPPFSRPRGLISMRGSALGPGRFFDSRGRLSAEMARVGDATFDSCEHGLAGSPPRAGHGGAPKVSVRIDRHGQTVEMGLGVSVPPVVCHRLRFYRKLLRRHKKPATYTE